MRALGGSSRTTGHPAPRSGFTLLELLVVVSVIAVLLGLLLPTMSLVRGLSRTTVCGSNLRQLQLANTDYANDHGDHYSPGAPNITAQNLERWHGKRRSPSAEFEPHGGPLTEYLGVGATEDVRACPTFQPTIDLPNTEGFGFERSSGGYGYNNAFVGVLRARTSLERWAIQSDQRGARTGMFAQPERTIAFADAAFALPAGSVEYSFIEPRFWPDFPSFRADPSTHFRHVGGKANVVWLDAHVSLEVRSFSWTSGLYGADPATQGIGWFGSADDNSLFDYE